MQLKSKFWLGFLYPPTQVSAKELNNQWWHLITLDDTWCSFMNDLLMILSFVHRATNKLTNWQTMLVVKSLSRLKNLLFLQFNFFYLFPTKIFSLVFYILLFIQCRVFLIYSFLYYRRSIIMKMGTSLVLIISYQYLKLNKW